MKSWEHYVDLLKPAGKLIDLITDGPDAQLRAALYRQFAMNLSQGYFLYFQSTAQHPDFAPFENSVFVAQPNPDATYHYAPVTGSGTYRVVGERGGTVVAGFATGNNIIGKASSPGQGFGNYDIDALDIAPGGSFDVIFSTARPAGYEGNWLHLHPEADFILARQFSYRWGQEPDMRLAIERLDSEPVKPAMSAEAIDRHLTDLFGGYMAQLSNIALQAVQRTRDRGFINRMALNSYQELGNSGDWPQAYFEMAFDLAEDEALLLETDLPENRPYWNVQVIDRLWNQVELVYRQSSLNGHQACIDSDGRFRAVLAHRDPGIANWLDTGGNLSGMLIGRWYRCSTQPTPSVQVMKFAALDGAIDKRSARITRDERASVLRERRIGAQLRRRW